MKTDGISKTTRAKWVALSESTLKDGFVWFVNKKWEIAGETLSRLRTHYDDREILAIDSTRAVQIELELGIDAEDAILAKNRLKATYGDK